MRVSTQIGVAGELLRDGSLKLSNAAQLPNLFERSDRNRGRQPASHGTGGSPDGAPPNDGTSGEREGLDRHDPERPRRSRLGQRRANRERTRAARYKGGAAERGRREGRRCRMQERSRAG